MCGTSSYIEKIIYLNKIDFDQQSNTEHDK